MISYPYEAMIVAEWIVDDNDDYIQIRGFVYGHWNGWTCPGFTKENAEQIVHFQTMHNNMIGEESVREFGTTLSWDGDVIIAYDYQWASEDPDYVAERIEPNEHGHYLIKGWSWTWEEQPIEAFLIS